MRKLTTLALLLSVWLVHSQEWEYEFEFPTYNPPSPEAYELTKYGGLEINESTGMAQYNLPLFDYQAGHLQVPISINYSGSGVKINDPNTWTGVNFTLNGGGLISRTVYDDPDETTAYRLTQQDYEAHDLNFPTDNAQPLYLKFKGNNWDTQPDVFSFNFSGHSGSFYLDDNFQPVQISCSEPLKIEILGTDSSSKINLANTKTFSITTSDGVKYFFGGSEIEISTTEYGPHTEVTPQAVTAYYLYRIEHPISGIIFLEYDTVSNVKQSIDVMHYVQAYNETYATGGYPIDGLIQKIDPSGALPSGGPILVLKKLEQGKYLRRIYSNFSGYQEVLFNSSVIQNGGFNCYRNLENIQVKKANEIGLEIDFTYDFDTASGETQRFFLRKVEFNKDNEVIGGGLDYKKFEFVYEDPMGLPARFSYAQDHQGYFNGATTNTGFFPTIVGPSSVASFSNGANRDYNFDARLKGTLKKVIYPTSGSSNFIYEPVLKKKVTRENFSIYVSKNGFPCDSEGCGGATYNNVYSAEDLIGPELIMVNEMGEQVESMPYDQEITFKVKVRALGIPTQNEPVTIYLKKFENGVESTIYTDQVVMVPSGSMENGSVYEKEMSFTKFIQADLIYKVELELNQNSGPEILAELSYSYDTDVDLVDGGDLRVQKIFDQTSTNDTINVKRYYYRSKEDVNIPDMDYVDFFVEPSYVKNVQLLVNVCDIGAPPSCYCIIKSHPGSKMDIYIGNNSKTFKYGTVTISHGGDNFENGGVEKFFSLENGGVVASLKAPDLSYSNFTNLLSSHDNATWSTNINGQLFKENFLVMEDQELKLSKRISYGFTNIERNVPQIGYLASFTDASCGDDMFSFSNTGVAFYHLHSRENSKESVLTEEFTEPFPFSNPLADETMVDKTSTLITYSYGEIIGLPDEIQKMDSDGSIGITKLRFADSSINNINDLNINSTDQQLTTDQLNAIIALNAANSHRLATPIQIEFYEKDDELSSERFLMAKRNLFGTDPNSGLIQLKTVSSYKFSEPVDLGNPQSESFEERILYTYDFNGNPAEVKTPGSGAVVYKWASSFNKPLMEIKNSNLSEVMSTSGDLYLNLPNAEITTYQYSGVLNLLSAIIDPRGLKTHFSYDEFNRLIRILDHDKNIVEEYNYNYKE